VCVRVENLCVEVCVYVWKCVCACVYIYIYVCACVCVCVWYTNRRMREYDGGDIIVVQFGLRLLKCL